MTTEEYMNLIILRDFKDFKCPDCGKNGIYGACIDTEYNIKLDKDMLVSFSVFCKYCGMSFNGWHK